MAMSDEVTFTCNYCSWKGTILMDLEQHYRSNHLSHERGQDQFQEVTADPQTSPTYSDNSVEILPQDFDDKISVSDSESFTEIEDLPSPSADDLSLIDLQVSDEICDSFNESIESLPSLGLDADLSGILVSSDSTEDVQSVYSNVKDEIFESLSDETYESSEETLSDIFSLSNFYQTTEGGDQRENKEGVKNNSNSVVFKHDDDDDNACKLFESDIKSCVAQEPVDEHVQRILEVVEYQSADVPTIDVRAVDEKGPFCLTNTNFTVIMSNFDYENGIFL